MGDGEFWRLEKVSDHDLRAGLRESLGQAARTEATIVAYLSAIAERRLHLEDGFSSMFKYCQKRQGMSEGEAFLRLNAVKLARRFPVLFQKLANREIHLSALRLLRKHLTPQNHLQLIQEASGKTKMQVLELLARHFPRARIDPTVRKLPPLRSENPRSALDERPPQHRAELLPVAEDRYRLQLDTSRRFKLKLDLAKSLGSHANPSGDIELILEQALDLWLEKVQKRRFGRTADPEKSKEPKVEKASGPTRPTPGPTRSTPEPARPTPEPARPTPEPTRPTPEPVPERITRPPIARATVREVTLRDGMQCSYVSPDGRRCGSEAFLQLHHEIAWARHGPDDATNLTWLCASHNRYFAEKDFGQEHVAERIARADRRQT